MVKFSFIALASALAAVSGASAAKPVAKKTIKLGNRNLRRGDAATEALLKKATPYKGKKTGAKKVNRRRAEEDEDEFEIDGSYSLQFSECVDINSLLMSSLMRSSPSSNLLANNLASSQVLATRAKIGYE